ncbi:MAG TPA: hypothetical protein VH113_00030 [Gemmatimonadales bacterium]|jgi:hypothetical protein|nr:hypothetical protein [Gemmatimonadales bacterium]
MRRPGLLILLSVLSVTACDRRGPVSRQTVTRSLQGLLVYPRSRLVDMSSGDSAGQVSLVSPDAPNVVAAWFRQYLTLNHWNLENDAVQGDGSITIYASRKGQPLWISIQHTSGGPGSSYTMTGAITDSTGTTRPDTTQTDSTQRSGSSMSSKRIQRR